MYKKQQELFQVAAVFIYRLHHQNDFPRYVSSLADCLRNSLEIDEEDVHFPLVASHCPEVSWSRWKIRLFTFGHGPLPSGELGQMKKTFIFLRSWSNALKGVGVGEEGIHFPLPLVTGQCPEVSSSKWKIHPFSFGHGHCPEVNSSR